MPILGTIFLGVLVLVCLVCINEINAFLPAFKTYIDSGRSLFLPDLPRINLFWFLPTEVQPIPLTWGNLIDVAVICNIVLIFGRIPYEYHHRASESQSMDQFVDLHLDRRYTKYRTRNTIIGEYTIPCIDARASLEFPAKRKAGRVELALKFAGQVDWCITETCWKNTRRESRRVGAALLACLAIRFLRIIPSSFLIKDFYDSGLTFPRNHRYILSLLRELKPNRKTLVRAWLTSKI